MNLLSIKLENDHLPEYCNLIRSNLQAGRSQVIYHTRNQNIYRIPKLDMNLQKKYTLPNTKNL